MKLTRGARPIKNQTVLDWYNKHEYQDISLEDYTNVWRNWLEFSDLNSITGLDQFTFAHYTQGTSQTFDNFAVRHAKNRCLIALQGEFQYHACLGKHIEFKALHHIHPDLMYGKNMHALIISAPFSEYGCMHPEFETTMDICNQFDIPVCLDLAYWGIGKHIHIDLDSFPCIKEVTCSLSKPFYTLENHRVGVRFAREDFDDGITMLNDVDMQNKHSMSLGVHFMKNFTPDWNWITHKENYEKICDEQDLVYTDTVIFGLGTDEQHEKFNRGIKNNHRVCISEFLGDVNDS